jgi:hypothetical protein
MAMRQLGYGSAGKKPVKATPWAKYPVRTMQTAKPPAVVNTQATVPFTHVATDQEINQTVNQRAPKYNGLTPQQINAQALRFRNTLPAPLTNQQITSRAQAALDPAIAKVTAAINSRVASQQQAVQGYTNRIAEQLAADAPGLGAPYQQAAQGVAAVNTSLADRLTNEGRQSGEDLTSRLAALNAPGAVGEAAQTLQREGAGAGNALYASGGADIKELLANAASAQSYGMKQPGIAKLGGIQQAGLVGRQGLTDIADKTAELEGQLPTILQNLRSMSEDRSQNRASMQDRIWEYLNSQGVAGKAAADKARTDLWTTLTGQSITQQATNFGYTDKAATNAAEAGKPILRNFGNGGVMAIDPVTLKKTIVQQPTAASVKSPKIDKDLSAAYKVLVDENGNKVVGTNGQPIPFTPYVKPGAGTKAKAKVRIKTDHGTLIEDPNSPSGWSIIPGSAPTTTEPPGTTKPGFSTSDVGTIAQEISAWHTGQSGTVDGSPVYDGPTLNWSEALAKARPRFPNTTVGQKKALALVNAEYGTPQTLASNDIKTLAGATKDPLQAVRWILEADKAGKLAVPLPYYTNLLARVFGVKPRDIQAMIHTVNKWETGAQDTGGTGNTTAAPGPTRHTSGAAWNPTSDPAVGYVGTMIKTKSGGLVQAGKYVG